MTTRLATLNPHQEYGVNDIGDVLSPSVNDAGNDEGFSFQDIESVLEQDLVLEPDLVDGSDVTDSTVSEEEEEDYINCWNPYLYQLQQKAPTARCVPCRDPTIRPPPIYGEEYHGCITRDEACSILGTRDGNYLVRAGLKTPGTYSLSFVFGQRVRHYHLYHDGESHFVGEKLFDTVEDVVADGLITLFMEKHNADRYLQSQRSSLVTIHNNLGGRSPSSSNGICVTAEGLRSTLNTISEQDVMCEDEQVEENFSCRNDCGIDPLATLIPHALPLVDPLKSPDDESTISDSQTPSLLLKQSILDTGTMFFNYKKPHKFKVHNYIGMVWCDLCRNFMWGLRAQGYKCSDCGYNVHKQCQDEVEPNCQPVKQKGKRIYGADLTTHVMLCSTKLPPVLRKCVEEVESRGMNTEGIYRISGHAQDTLSIKEKFNKEGCDSEVDLSSVDIHAVASALKLYLRELPIPLVTYEAYDLCVIATRCESKEECMEKLQLAMQRLTKPHFNALKYLLHHLNRIEKCKRHNKMTFKNLAVVFAPTLLRSPQQNGLMEVKRLPGQREAVELLIKNYKTLLT